MDADDKTWCRVDTPCWAVLDTPDIHIKAECQLSADQGSKLPSCGLTQFWWLQWPVGINPTSIVLSHSPPPHCSSSGLCSSLSSVSSVSSVSSPDGPLHSHPPHPGGRRLPSFRLAQGCPLRQRRPIGGLAEVLGRPRGLLCPGAPGRPPAEPPELLLPPLLGPQVLLPGLVHDPSQMERQWPPLQPGEILAIKPRNSLYIFEKFSICPNLTF